MATGVPTVNKEDDEVEVSDPKLEVLARSLRATGAGLEVVAVVGGLCALGGGFYVLAHTTTNASGATNHPDVPGGLAIVLGAVVGGLFLWALARCVRVFGRYTAFRTMAETERHLYQWQGESARQKECPDCCELVWEEARVCRYCTYRFAHWPAAS